MVIDEIQLRVSEIIGCRDKEKAFTWCKGFLNYLLVVIVDYFFFNVFN